MPAFVPGESRDDFLDRCMDDPETVAEYPDAGQRFAVCASMWEHHAEKIDRARKAVAAAELADGDQEMRCAWGWFSVCEVNGEPVIDADGDVLTEGELVRMAHRALRAGIGSKLMHEGRRIGELVESLVFTKDLQAALGIDLGMVGWLGCMHFTDAVVWSRVKAGELLEWSIGGNGERRVVLKWRRIPE